MNKGKRIRQYIAEGMSDTYILYNVDTTINSIRWHRSKMKASTQGHGEFAGRGRIGTPTALTAAVDKFVGSRTVGEILEKRGLVEQVRECLRRVKAHEDLYDRIAEWRFVTNDKVTSRLGKCNYRTKTLEVHARLLDFADDFRTTLFHEIAHALDKMMHGRSSSHGPEWKFIMAIGFRLPAVSYGDHSEEVNETMRDLRAAQSVETWACTRCGHEEHIMRKRKHPPSAYRHRRCGGSYKVKD